MDVSGTRLHAVVLDGRRAVVASEVWAAGDPEGLVAWLVSAGVDRVAIDSPAGVSDSSHAADEALGRKFRSARCGEVALGRERGIWVAWVPPPVRPAEPWMEVGFALFDACRAAGLDAVETYPYAIFRTLAGGARLPKKSSAAGRAARVSLLARAGVPVDDLVTTSHDALDAAAAAIVAVDREAAAVTCGHDGSAIWLPSAP